MGPNYVPPKNVAPDKWHVEVTKDLKHDQTPLQTWWKVFKDPDLETVIYQLRTNNLDLVEAVARMDEASARYGIARSGLFPMLDGVGGISRSRASERINSKTSLPNNPTTIYDTGFTMGWELDVWGRVRRGMEVAGGQWQASIEDTRDLLVMLQADAATTYITYRTLQQRLEVAQNNVKLQEATLKLTRDRHAAELTGELDIRQAELNLASTHAFIPELEAQCTRALNHLCLLTGNFPGAMTALIKQTAALPHVHDVPTLLPAELLRRRPDVRAAERRLAARTAQVGATTAELYPMFSLNGAFEWQASSSGDLFNSASRTYGLGPSFRWSLFSGQKIRSAIKADEARTRQALAAYEKSVLVAYQESEDALSAYANELNRLAALREAVTAAEKSADLVDTLYRNGLVDFQNVLNTQRLLFEQQDALAFSQGVTAQNLISIYKAFGGGWDVPTPPSSVKP